MESKIEIVRTQDIKLPENLQINEDEIRSLAASIRENGLFHPPVIKSNMEIVAGTKRVVAARRCDLKAILCMIVPSDLDLEDYKAISLHENLKRYNLPWYEQVIKEKELHELRIAQHGEGKKGKKIGWSIRDTAKELEISFGGLSEDLKIAEAVLSDPGLRRIEDKTTAKRIILQITKRVEQELTSGIPAQLQGSVQEDEVLMGGSEEILKAFPDKTFDACITDPPWIEFKDPSLAKDEFTFRVFKEVFRVLKVNSFLFAFVSNQDWLIYEQQLTALGFVVQKWPLIWVKEGSLSRGNKTWEFQRDYEPILVAVKGSPALTAGMLSSVYSCSVVPSVKLIHPNEKPAAVIRRLIESSTYENALILDPFAGSGIVAETAHAMNRKYVVIEKDREYFLKIRERLGIKDENSH